MCVMYTILHFSAKETLHRTAYNIIHPQFNHSAPHHNAIKINSREMQNKSVQLETGDSKNRGLRRNK